MPASAVRHIEDLLNEARIPAGDLRAAIPAYLAELEQATRKHEFLDITLARTLAARCIALLDEIDIDTPPEHRRLIQAAVRYFLLSNDADSDKESLIGFDDDARVIGLIAREIGPEGLGDDNAREGTPGESGQEDSLGENSRESILAENAHEDHRA